MKEEFEFIEGALICTAERIGDDYVATDVDVGLECPRGLAAVIEQWWDDHADYYLEQRRLGEDNDRDDERTHELREEGVL